MKVFSRRLMLDVDYNEKMGPRYADAGQGSALQRSPDRVALGIALLLGALLACC